MSSHYDHKAIEAKWQDRWEKHRIAETDLRQARDKYYMLMMFPYPSGDRLHVGTAATTSSATRSSATSACTASGP
jgi:leucyl-tRNA synthetase